MIFRYLEYSTIIDVAACSRISFHNLKNVLFFKKSKIQRHEKDLHDEKVYIKQYNEDDKKNYIA